MRGAASSIAVALTRTPWLLLLGGMLCLWGAGCSQQSVAISEEDEEFFADADESEPTGEPKKRVRVPKAPALVQDRLELKLQPGDRFPLVKTVEQRLTQQGDEPGSEVVGYSRLELTLGVTVDEVRDAARLMSVHYDRVRFFQDLGQQQIEYDSDAPPAELASEVWPYAGLAGNGFSFWLGADHQILELIEFPQFLVRCVQHVPAVYRQQVFEQLEKMRSDESVANFVDDSLGLLPSPGRGGKTNPLVHEGSSWNLKPRQVDGPVPMLISTKCLLQELSDSQAVIDVVGQISPTSVQHEDTGVKVTVQGGRVSGTCLVDRASGLSVNSRIDRDFDMVVEMADGSVIPQRKTVITTVQTFLDQQPVQLGAAAPAKEPAGASTTKRNAKAANRRESAIQPAGYSADPRQNASGEDRSGLDEDFDVAPEPPEVEPAPKRSQTRSRR